MESCLAVDDHSQQVHAELDRVRRTFAHHVAEMTPEDLDRPSNGTKWTNRELLFHMLFGYLVVRRLLPLVKGLGRFATEGKQAVCGSPRCIGDAVRLD